jgi:hypothetical protein
MAGSSPAMTTSHPPAAAKRLNGQPTLYDFPVASIRRGFHLGRVSLKTASVAMTAEPKLYTGGCLCGALRYEAFGKPIGSGHCYCVDCRRASGSGFVAFMGFRAEDVRFSGEAREFHSKAANGGDAVRNRCAQCMSLVFGGELGKSDSYTLSLDDPSAFHPTIAIFAEGRPLWAIIPNGFKVFDRMPG